MDSKGAKVQKCVDLVDLVKSFQTSIYLEILASIQPRTGLSKFAKIQNLPTVRKESKNIGAGSASRRRGEERDNTRSSSKKARSSRSRSAP